MCQYMNTILLYGRNSKQPEVKVFVVKILKIIKNLLSDPVVRFGYFTKLGLTRHMSDKKYLQKKFKLVFGYDLDLDNPRTFNEKLQWLKLYDRNPEYTIMVDKYRVRKYISEKIGEEYLIPLLGVWDSPDEIDFDKLPDQFVLKCNHNSGIGMCICRNKSELDINKVKSELRKGLKENYYWGGREWPYKDVPKKIIAEKYMEDKNIGALNDYKIFCFDGKAKFMFVATERQNKDTETKFDFYDMDFNHLPFTNGHPNSKAEIKCPSMLQEMKNIAEILSQNIPHLRVDLYEINGRIYFGELTFSHWSGFVPFDPKEWDFKFGDLIKLPEKRV